MSYIEQGRSVGPAPVKPEVDSMQGMQPFEQMERFSSNATKSEKKIIAYILAHRSDVPFLSVSGLAEACGVGDATVSRFCRALGYEGYAAFRVALSRALTSSPLLSVTPMSEEIRMEDTVEEMAHKLLANNISAMTETLFLMQADAVRQAVQYLSEAGCVYCFGQGASGLIAQDAWARFSTVSPRFHTISDNHLQTCAMSLCSAGDVLLYFSYSGATRDGEDLLRLARENEVKVILVTRHARSPAARYADVVLPCGSKEAPLQTGSISAKIAQLFLVDVLVNEFCRRNPQDTARNRERTARAVTTKHL